MSSNQKTKEPIDDMSLLELPFPEVDLLVNPKIMAEVKRQMALLPKTLEDTVKFLADPKCRKSIFPEMLHTLEASVAYVSSLNDDKKKKDDQNTKKEN